MAYDNLTITKRLEHDTNNGNFSSFVKIDDTHFILAYTSYQTNTNRGIIKTFSIDQNDNITQQGEYLHENFNNCISNSLVHLTGNFYVLMFHDSTASEIKLKLFEISGTNFTTITERSSITVDSRNAVQYPTLVKVSDTNVLGAYSIDQFGVNGYGQIVTYFINTTTYSFFQQDIQDYGDNYLYSNRLTALYPTDSNYFLLSYNEDPQLQPTYQLKFLMIDTDQNGQVGKGNIFNTGLSAIHRHDTIGGFGTAHFIVSYYYATGSPVTYVRCYNYDVGLDTYSITDTKDVGNTGGWPFLQRLDSNYYLMAYGNSSWVFTVITVHLDATYKITLGTTPHSDVNSLTITGGANNEGLLVARDDYYLCAFTGSAGYDGYIYGIGSDGGPTSNFNMKINVGESWEDVESAKINVKGEWKDIDSINININTEWEE